MGNNKFMLEPKYMITSLRLSVPLAELIDKIVAASKILHVHGRLDDYYMNKSDFIRKAITEKIKREKWMIEEAEKLAKEEKNK